MPQRPAKICARVGCANNADKDCQGYCSKHKPAYNWKSDKQRGTSTQRGYGYKWQKLRLSILERDNYLCVPCLSQGKWTSAKEVDHIKPKQFGGTDDAHNLQSICIACHKHKTATERRGGCKKV